MNMIERALRDLQQGKMVILVDDEHRENEGDLIIAAQHVTAEAINFMATFARGLICLSLTEHDVQRLQLPSMVGVNSSKLGTNFTVSIEAREGVTTGISAPDRAHTIRVAIDPTTTAADVVTPGHIFPLCAKAGGVLVRRGQTEGSVDLCKIAGLKPAAVICEVMNDDGTMARMPQLRAFAEKHDLSIVTIEELVTYRMTHDIIINEVATAQLPIKNHGQFTIKVFRHLFDNTEHVALIREPIHRDAPVWVRIHSECLTGDVFGSERCDCQWQWQAACAKVAQEGGVLCYLRQEGRGIGLGNKIKAYALQEQGLDTVEANHQLGFAADNRQYAIAAQILKMLNITDVKLLTNNPQKVAELKKYGVARVERSPLIMPKNAFNEKYLTVKAAKLGHWLHEPDQGDKS